MAKRMTIVIILLVVFFGGLVGWNLLKYFGMKSYFAHFQPPPVVISSTIAKAETWHPQLSSVGNLKAIHGVQVSAEASGMITQVYFNDGQMVKQGDPLLQLDDRIDQQDLKNNVATLELAKISYQRQSDLFKRNATSKSALDEASAKLQQAEAAVAKSKVMIDQKTIKAPFSGKIGIRQIDLGQYVSPGNPLVSLQALDPLYLEFNLPEQDLPKIKTGQIVKLTVDSQPGRTFTGKVTAINATVNEQTHNILVQATVPNKDLALYPGLFANVGVILPEQKDVITLPQTAIDYNLYGDSVFIIETKGKDKKGQPMYEAKRQYVTVGERRGNQVAILKGVKAGEQVVTSGQLKLQDHARVEINNKVTPN